MNSKNLMIAAVMSIFLMGTTFGADDDKQSRGDLAAVALTDVLDAVQRQSKMTFAIDNAVHPEVVVGQLSVRNMTYENLLLVLRNNQLAAVRSGGNVNIIPVRAVRQTALPLLFAPDNSIHDEEWVTRVVKLQHAPAINLVPILRPLLPQQGHMAAYPHANALIIVDRHGNVKRVVAMISALDEEAKPQLQ